MKHYFFYGMGTEDAIAGLIRAAEVKGCEFVQLIPGMVPVQTSRLALANGRGAQPQMIPVLRLFVRCEEAAFPGIRAAMDEDAKREQSEDAQRASGFRQGVQ